MPVSSLLDIDPDQLFKQRSIQEVEEVQKKLHHEIERKREELRTMVGERYRDLIEAADKIAEMKLISERVIEDVDRMSAATSQMQETQVSGFKGDKNKSLSNKSVDKWSKVAAQIKVLVDITEHVWTAVDCKDFTKATLLFVLAKHIKTSLEMDQLTNTSQNFPVIARQSASMSHFKDTILKGAEDALKVQHLSPESACGSLISILLLEGLNSSQMLKRYLSLRSSALKTVLTYSYQTPDSSVVKQRLCDSHSLLLNSVVSLCHCFIESDAGEGLLWKHLKMVTGKQAPPTLSLMNLQEFDVYTNFLPPVVHDFRPHTVKVVEPVSSNEMHLAVSEWLTWVRQFVTDQGGHLLQLLSSLRSLQGLRNAPQAVPDEWSLVIQKLLLPPSLNLWTELYRPLITVRTKQLINVHWDSSVKYVENEIKRAVDMAFQEGKQTETDLCWHVWKENQNDLTNKPTDTSSDKRNNKGLWLKSKGISPRVADLCNTLESRLSTLLGDLSTVCSDKELDPAIVADTHALKGHQQVVCSEAISRLVEHVKKELNEHERNEITSILLARFLQSIPELCPSLQKCLSSSDSKTVSWQETCTFLYSESLAVYKIWQELMRNTLSNIIKEFLKQPDMLSDLLHSTPQWELITIEEEGEGGEVLKSELRVPSSPSLTLQSTLNTIANYIGHTFVPKHVTEELVAQLVPTIMACYRGSAVDLSVQSHYLQQFLDVKYAAAILIPSHNKALQQVWQETVSEVESKIDPFDLNVFMPYIDDNVKRSVHRTYSLLGVITGCHNTATVLTSKSEEPSVLVMSSSAASTWFPLLHITAPHSSRAILAPKPKDMKKSPSTPSLDASQESTLKQSASSFFGVMATDWFG